MASILSNILPLLQSHDVFTSALNQTIDLHNEALEQNERQFQIMKDMEISQHEEEMQVEWKIHCAEVAHNIELARRESIRDVWSQRTQLIQTVMIVDSLIFGSAFSLLVEGNPPNNVPEAVTILYAILIALSLDCIFLSLWLAFIVQARMSRFNMHDPYLRYVCGLTHLTFGDYYKCHCLGLWRLVLAMFYIGTVLTLISSSILLFTKFQYSYMHTAGATIFVAIVGTTVLLVPFGEYLWPSNTRRTNFSSEDFRPSAHPNSYYKASRSTKNGDSSSYPFTEEQNPGVDSSTLSDASGLGHSTKRNSFQFEDDESNWSPARHQRSVQSVTPRLCTSSESTRGAGDWTPPGTSPEISEVGTPRPPRLIIPIYSHT